MKRQLIIVLAVSVGIVTSVLLPFTGCANRGIGPQGGPKDTIAPQIVKMTVPNGSCNVTSQQMVIQLNEYVQIDGSTDNILVSPPQQRPPEIKAVGKKVEIQFKEPLKDSTTYTIDFGNQLVDNNEKNPLPDFCYSFSTGAQIDSLEVYGTLINAEDLNPISGVVIGLHQQLEDSALFTHPFTRIARTNPQGEFAIRNVKEGTYRLYALQDMSRDYVFQPGEGVAFSDETVTPYISTETVKDTIGDSVVTMEYFYYEPSNLLLRLFKGDYERMYFQRLLRKDAERIQLVFSSPQPSVPVLKALRLESDSLGLDSSWVDFTQHSLIQQSPRMDTFTIWLTDSLAIRMDSVRMEMTYTMTDSLFQPGLQTDTLLAVYRAPVRSERTRRTLAQKKEKQGLAINSNASSKWNFFDTLLIQSPTPIAHFEADSIQLFSQQDTVLTPVARTLVKKDSAGLQLMVLAPWKPRASYVLEVDSAAIIDIYGQSCKKTTFKIQVRSTEEYANMKVFLSPYSEQAYIQLLDNQDKPVRVAKAEPNGTLFNYLEAGVYYMRAYMDANGDGKWTTGDVKTHRQPEAVYYFPKKMTLRANWEFEEHFNWQVVPLLQQKPQAIRKDAAQDDKKQQ